MHGRTVEGETIAPTAVPQLEVLVRGVFDKRRFLNLVRHFLVSRMPDFSGQERTLRKSSGGKTGGPVVNCHLVISAVSLARRKSFGRLAQW